MNDLQGAAARPMSVLVSLDGHVVWKLVLDSMPTDMKRGQRRLLIALLEHFTDELYRQWKEQDSDSYQMDIRSPTHGRP
jgi:hypothetical protein